jgi:hypothetical protein
MPDTQLARQLSRGREVRLSVRARAHVDAQWVWSALDVFIAR